MTDEIKIRIAGVVKESIVDGPGIRFTIFCQGCPHGCKGCHNPVTHDFDGGYDCQISKILMAIDENPLINGVTFSGGEPACQSEGFLALAREIKKRSLNIVMYSGYTYEQLQTKKKNDNYLSELLNLVDFLIDGRYNEKERDLTLQFRGSTNQRIIDVQKTIENGKVVIVEKF